VLGEDRAGNQDNPQCRAQRRPMRRGSNCGSYLSSEPRIGSNLRSRRPRAGV